MKHFQWIRQMDGKYLGVLYGRENFIIAEVSKDGLNVKACDTERSVLSLAPLNKKETASARLERQIEYAQEEATKLIDRMVAAWVNARLSQ